MADLSWYQQHGIGVPQRPAAPPAPVGVPIFRPTVPGAPQAPGETPQYPGAPPIGQVSVGSAVQYWKGSREAQAGACPRCGSPNYFDTVRDEGGRVIGMGHCTMCSYRPGHAVLSGPTMQENTQGIRSLNGPDVPVRPARQVSGGRTPWGVSGNIRPSNGHLDSVIGHI